MGGTSLYVRPDLNFQIEYHLENWVFAMTLQRNIQRQFTQNVMRVDSYDGHIKTHVVK